MVHSVVLIQFPMLEMYPSKNLRFYNQSHTSLTSLLIKLYVALGMFIFLLSATSSNSLQEHYIAKSFLLLMSSLFCLSLAINNMKMLSNTFFSIHITSKTCLIKKLSQYSKYQNIFFLHQLWLSQNPCNFSLLFRKIPSFWTHPTRNWYPCGLNWWESKRYGWWQSNSIAFLEYFRENNLVWLM